MLRVSEEDDLAILDTADKFNTFLRDATDTASQEHLGSPESQALLAVSLENRRSRFAGKAASMTIEAQKANVQNVMNGSMNQLVAAIRQNPASLSEQRISLRAVVDEFRGALSAAEERAFIQAGDSILGEASIETMILQGGVDQAERLLLDQPGLLASLDPNAQKRLFDKITAFRQEQSQAQNEGFAALALTRAILGPDATEEEVRDSTARRADLTPAPTKMVEIGDETSPTGSRWVPAAEALGQPGRPRGALVEITNQGEAAMEKELGKLDAQHVIDLETEGQIAFRTLDQLERMEAAIESGRFTTGVFGGARSFLANFASFVGAGPEIDELIGDAATADTLDAASNQLALNAAEKLGRITNMSLTLIRDSFPNLTRTPEGNEILIEVMKRTANRRIELATLSNTFIQDFKSLRPEGQRTFFQAMRDLEESDPVISEDLRQRIIEGGRVGPNSFSEIFGEAGEAIQGLTGAVPNLTTTEEFDALEPGATFKWFGDTFTKPEAGELLEK